MTSYLLEVKNGEPRILDTYEDWREGVSRQLELDDEARAEGIPARELWFGLRPEDDAQGLVQRALETPFAPEPEKPKRRQTRMVEGVKLIHRDGQWVSEDGRYAIDYVDDFETECDAPHPVKISQALRDEFYSTPEHERYQRFGLTVYSAIHDNKRGYYCEGNEIHCYALWVVWSKDLDVISRDETFAQALEALGEHLRTGRTFA